MTQTITPLLASDNALVRLLGQIETERSRPDRPQDYTRYSVTDLMAMTEADELIRDPVRYACGNAVTDIGRHLHANGVDLDAVAERVLARAPKRFRGKWMSTLADRWNGVGDWSS